MSMEEMQELVDQLKTEIDKLDDEEIEIRDRASAIIADLEREIDEEDDTLVEKLSEIVDEFQEDHPAITGIIGNISNSLSNLGI